MSAAYDTVAESSQQAVLKLGERRQSLAWFPQFCKVATEREPAVGPACKPLEWCPTNVVVPLRFLLTLEPRVDASLDITLEDLGEVVVAVELVR